MPRRSKIRKKLLSASFHEKTFFRLLFKSDQERPLRIALPKADPIFVSDAAAGFNFLVESKQKLYVSFAWRISMKAILRKKNKILQNRLSRNLMRSGTKIVQTVTEH